MNKLKFGNRLKLFQRHASPNKSRHPSRNRSRSPARESLDVGRPRSTGGELPDIGVDHNSIDLSRSSASDDDVSFDSSSSSIVSGDRNAGPIDVDTLRRHRLKVRNKDAGARMPKIIESPSSCTHGSGWEKSLNGSHGGGMSETTAPHSNQRYLSPPFSLSFKSERSGKSIAPKSVGDPTVTPALAHTATTAHNADKAHASANAHATANLNVVEYENPQLLKYTTPSQCSSGESQESNFINGNNLTGKVDRTSPSSVVYMFDSSYPIEIDPEGSIGSDCIAEKYSLAESDEPSLLLPTLSDNYALSDTLDRYAIPAGQTINALTALPKVTTVPTDSSSLLIALAEKLSNATGGDQCVVPPEESGGASSIKCGNASSSMENTGTARDNNGASAVVGSMVTSGSYDNKGSGSLSKEFLVLKKVAEKNEFKMVVALSNKKSSTSPNVVSNLSSTSTDGKLMNYDELVKLPDILIHGNNKSGVEDPPDIVITNSLSADPFKGIEEDPTGLSPSPPQPLFQEKIVPMDQDFIILREDSFPSYSSDSSDSFSYMSDVSDLEVIGDISICDETKRLIEAHTLYAEDAATNIYHPARQKKSAMRVGSVFKNLENTRCQLNQPAPLSSDLNKKRTRTLSRIRSLKTSGSLPKVDEDCIAVTKVPVEPSISSDSSCSIKTSRNRKLTWYDDEVNWSKPFTLRTDESFDASTISSAVYSRLKGITQYNVMDQFIGSFVNGICQFRGNVDFDILEQEEI